MNQTLRDIANRRSIRSYTSEQISEEDLSAILEAGRNAPSGKNKQPWHFTVIQNREILDWIEQTNREIILASPDLTKMNRWQLKPDYHNFFGAPTVVLISGETGNPLSSCDCALAMQNMSLAAHSLSLGSCMVLSTQYLFQTDKAREYMDKLSIPHEYAPFCALTLGYAAGDPPNPLPRKQDNVNFIR